jgi:uncharacterized protein (DUF1697 family)
MTGFVALLRAVNVGGRKLLMSDLKAIATKIGLTAPRTFIASGNLIFRSEAGEQALKRKLEAALERHMDAAVPVMIRSAQELAEVAAANPFKSAPANRVAAIFLDQPPPKDAVAQAKNVLNETIALGAREIFVHYPDGMGTSKLRIPAAAGGTARNMNSVARLAELAKEQA